MFQKYAPALLNVLFIVLVAAKTLTLDLGSIEQFGLLVVGAVVIFIVPLADHHWQGYLKTGTGIVIALLTALVPLASQGWHLTSPQIITVVLAGVSAIAVEFGVQIMSDTPPLAALVTNVTVTGGPVLTSAGIAAAAISTPTVKA